MVPSKLQQLRDASAIDRMSSWQLQEWAEGFVPKWTKYIPHTPFPNQWAFLMLDCKEAMYGGAAGGGKSDALLMGALQYVDQPGYSALLLRHSYADLEKAGSLIPRSHEWLDPFRPKVHWRGDAHRWEFPSGATLEFGYLDHDDHLQSYQGGAWQYVGFDEMTQFKENWYRYLFSRTRKLRTQLDIPIRIRGATNPGGQGHEWVRQRFLIEGILRGRVFIPSRLEDNPHLDQEEYEKSLDELDPTTRAQLRWGRWDVRPPGQFFQRHWFRIIPAAPVGARPIRMWDLAATKNQSSAYTAGALISINAGKLCIHDMRRVRGDPGEVEQTILQTAHLDGRAIPIHMEKEGGSGGINTIYRYRHSVLPGWSFHEYVPKHDKLTRASPLSALARGGGVELVEGAWNGPYLEEFGVFPDGFKDQVDVCSAALQVLTQRPDIKLTRL